MKRRVLAVFVLLHGLAHSSFVIWSDARASAWMITTAWGVAMVGYLAAGLGLLAVPLLRRHWRLMLGAATAASILLLVTCDPFFAAIGVGLDAVLCLIAFGDDATAIDRHVEGAAARAAVHHPAWHRVGWGLGAVALAYVAAVAVLHPMFVRWGSTPDERGLALFGDELVAHPRYRLDHAITIRAPADSVWPWLVQVGQTRAGFYSIDRLERLFGVRIHNADRIHPEWQRLSVGDSVFATQPGYLGMGRLGWRVSAMDSGRALILDKWGAFIIQPLDSATSRLIVRTRGDGTPSLLGLVLGPVSIFMFEPAHFIMQRAMLEGIRGRVERAWERRGIPG